MIPQFVLGKFVRFVRLCLVSASLFGMTMLVRCDSGRIPTFATSGKVTFKDGQPVQFGSIEFYNQEHDVSARGTINSDGTYQLSTFRPNDGAVEGTHQVLITQILMPKPVVSEGATAEREYQHGRHIDKSYSSFSTSNLQCQVKQGANAIDFQVEIAK